MAKYHWITLCAAALIPLLAGASRPPEFPLHQIPPPQAEGVRQFLRRSQLPTHLKDVLENVLLKGPYLQAGMDFNFGGGDMPVDWHLDRKTRRVFGHVDMRTSTISIYPGFYSLKPQKQIHMLIHMGLHLLPGLGLSRISESTIQQLTELLIKDQEIHGDEKRREMRAELRRFVDQKWAVSPAGSIYLAPGLEEKILPPWPFVRRKLEAQNGRE